MQPTVLLFAVSSQRAEAVKLVCLSLRIMVKTVEKERYHQSLGSLTAPAPSDAATYKGPDFSEEMMVMAGFSRPLLDRFLARWRALGLPPVSLKCVLTPTNALWSPVKLHQELQQERAQLRKISRQP